MKNTAAVVAFLLLASGAAHAADRLGTPFGDRFRLTSGLLSVATETQVRSDADNGSPGTLVSGEKDLGLRERTEMADVEAELRLRPRHKLRFNYFQLDRRAQTQLTRQIDFGNQSYLVDDFTQSRLAVSNFSVTYSYLFMRRERFELGASLGLQMYQFEGDVDVPARLIKEQESESAPVPILGLEAAVRFSSRWHAEARAEYLSATVDQVEGNMKNLRAGVFYRFSNNIAAGLGYALCNSRVLLKDPGNSGRWNFDNRGGELLFRVSF